MSQRIIYIRYRNLLSRSEAAEAGTHYGPEIRDDFIGGRKRRHEHATENPAAARPRRASVKKALRSARHVVLVKIDAFFFSPDTTPWDIMRIGAALLVLGPLLLSGFSGNYERLYGHWGSLPRSESFGCHLLARIRLSSEL